MSFTIEKLYCFLVIHTKTNSGARQECSLTASLFWKASPTKLLHYQDNNETGLICFCSFLQDALEVHKTESFKQVAEVKYRLELSSSQSEADQNIISHTLTISTCKPMTHSTKRLLDALIFWSEIKYFTQKYTKLFSNSVISRRPTNTHYTTVTFRLMCCKRNVLNLVWFVSRTVFFPTVFL